MMPEPDLEQACRVNRVKIRRHGLAVLAVLDESREPLPSRDVWCRARILNRKVSLTTVSRTLRDLCDAGILRRGLLADGVPCYAKAHRADQGHIVDVDSGEAHPIRDTRIEAAIRGAVAAMGYELESYRLDVFCRSRKLVRFPQRKAKLAGLVLLCVNAFDLPWMEFAQLAG